MTFLPIVQRELRMGSRRRSTYRIRSMAALITCVIVSGSLVLSGRWNAPTNVGQSLFRMLAFLAFIYCLLEGLRKTADCLSEEKRAGTLGLLFLTDLKGYDVVLGKLLATSLNSFYGLLAVFPAFAVCFTLGGVTPGEFWRIVLVLVNTLFLSLSLGLWVSAKSYQAPRAWTGVFAMMGLLVAGPLLLDAVRPATAGPLFALLSPASDFRWAFDSAYRQSSTSYWISLLGLHWLSWLFLAVASHALPRSWAAGNLTVGARLFSQTVSQPSAGQSTFGHGARPKKQLMEINPALWLAQRGNRHRQLLWILIGAAGCVELAVWFLSDTGRREVGLLNVSSVFMLHLIFRLWVASQACHSFAEARSSGLLELMIATPLKSTEIIQGQLLGLKKMFGGPAAALLSVEAAFLVGSFFSSVSSGQDALAFAGVVIIVGASMITFVADLVALSWVGMWLGLSSKKTNQAIMKTIFFVLALPWLALLLVPVFGILVWIFWPLVDLAWVSWAQNKLTQNFRHLATHRFDFPDNKEDRFPFRAVLMKQ